MLRRWTVFAFVAASWTGGALAGASTAIAKDPPHSGPALAQYRESVPSAGGVVYVDARPRMRPSPASTAPSGRARTESRAGLLKKVATETSYGAPSKRLRGTGRDAFARSRADGALRAAPEAAAAVGSSSRFVAVIVVLAAGAAAAAFIRRSRARR